MIEQSHEYFDFACPLQGEEQFRAEVVNAELERCGEGAVLFEQAELDAMHGCYTWSGKRYFHSEDHCGFMGQPYLPPGLRRVLSGREGMGWYASVASYAGFGHDAGYLNVDGQFKPDQEAVPPSMWELIGDLVDYDIELYNNKPVYRTRLKPGALDDEVTRMVAQVFDFNSAEGMIHNQGGNEFFSALFTAKLAEWHGRSPKFVMAVTAAIEATRPFLPSGVDAVGEIIDDGRMNDLANRLMNTKLRLHGVEYQPDYIDLNDIGLLATHTANRDASPLFLNENAHEVIHGGWLVRTEEVWLPDDPTMFDLLDFADPDRSAPSLYDKLRTNGWDVVHYWLLRNRQGQLPQNPEEHMFPPLPVYWAGVRDAENNTDLARAFFKAYRFGPLIAALIDVCVDMPHAKVAESVDSKIGTRPRPQSRLTRPLTPRETVVQQALEGTGQADISPVTTEESPISATVHGAIGRAGIQQLDEILKSYRLAGMSLARRERAFVFLAHTCRLIGRKNFQIILEQQKAVTHVHAPVAVRQRRLDKLDALQNELHAAAMVPYSRVDQ